MFCREGNRREGAGGMDPVHIESSAHRPEWCNLCPHPGLTLYVYRLMWTGHTYTFYDLLVLWSFLYSVNFRLARSGFLILWCSFARRGVGFYIKRHPSYYTYLRHQRSHKDNCQHPVSVWGDTLLSTEKLSISIRHTNKISGYPGVCICGM